MTQSTTATMRVVVVAEHPLIAEGIRRDLRHAPGCDVVGFVDGNRGCAAPLADARPDVVLVDEPESSDARLTWIRDARSALPDAKIILLTPRMDSDWLAEAASAGIDAAVGKTGHGQSLGLLIRAVAKGNVFHSFRAGSGGQRRDQRATSGLTGRELEILALVAAGASNSRIASQLWVTEQTVKFHLSNLYRKLSVANRTEASHYAHMHGLLEPVAGAATGAAFQVAA